eukprot:4705074-Prymnesium_polylepis.1
MPEWHINLYRGLANDLAQGTFRLEKFYGQSATCYDSQESALLPAGNAVAFQLNYTGLDSTTNAGLAGHDTTNCSWIGASSWGNCSSDGEEIGPVPVLAYFLLRDPNAIQEDRLRVFDWTTGSGQYQAFFDLMIANTSRYIPPEETHNNITTNNTNGLKKGVLEVGLSNSRSTDMH